MSKKIIYLDDAIDAIEKTYGSIAYQEDGFTRSDAIDILKALPSAQPETHDKRTETHACDLISRQMLLEYIHGEPVGRLLCDKYNLDGLIEQFPSAQPERMKGKWERHYCEDGNPDGWRCDNCDEWYYFGQTLPNFCPNCGAQMER